MKKTALLNSILALIKTVTGAEASPELTEAIEDTMEGSGLDDELATPSWITEIFQALSEKRTVPVSTQTKASIDGASFYNFFDELSQVVPMTWVEYGEYFLMQFPSIGLEAKISLEDNSYAVRPLSQ